MILDGWQAKWGYGRHIYYLLKTPRSRQHLLQGSKINAINEGLMMFELMVIKFSIAFFLLRIFGTNRACRWTVWIIVAFVFATSVLPTIAIFGECRPFSKIWDPTTPGKCWNQEVMVTIAYVSGGQFLQANKAHKRTLLILREVASVLSDWALSSVPIVVMWNLQMSTGRKAGVAALMGLGYL